MADVRMVPVDPATGNPLDGSAGTLAWLPARDPNDFQKEGWFSMSLKVSQVAKLGLGLEAHRVFLWLLGQVGYENWVVLKQAKIAEELGMRPSSVSRAFRHLLDAGVLERGPADGPAGVWRVSHDLIWRGQGRVHREARKLSKVVSLDSVRRGVEA